MSLNPLHRHRFHCFKSDDDDDDDEYQYWYLKVTRDGYQLRDAPEHIRSSKSIVMAAVQNDGYALRYASPDLQNDKQVVIAAVKENGKAFKYAHEDMQNDKDIALLYLKHNPDNIKHLNDELKSDPDMLIAAGMFDEDHDDATVRRRGRRRQQRSTNDDTRRKIVFSTRFSLHKSSHSEATNFTARFKKSKFYQEGNFIVYAPNAFDKKTCDPDWTTFDWPCRGTSDTCTYKNKLTPEGHPTDDCCWRYSFRNQLLEAKDTGGFMLQLIETEPSIRTINGRIKDATLGQGQQIELDMANTIGTKVFQVYCPEFEGRQWVFSNDHIDVVTDEISCWYDNNKCQDIMSVTIIRQPIFPFRRG